MTELIRVGVIGTGRIGRMHAELLERRVPGLARAAVFDTDEGAAQEVGALPPAPIPYDTTLDAAATAAALGVELPSLRALLQRFRAERSTSP